MEKFRKLTIRELVFGIGCSNYIGIIGISLLMSACNNSVSPKPTSNKTQISSDINEPVEKPYTIIGNRVQGDKKCEIDVRIQTKFKDDELRGIANEIKQSLDSKWEIIYIFFFLPKMEVGNGAWARVTFDPSMNLEVIGQTIEQENSINSYLAVNQQKFIGQWVDDFLKMGIIHRMKIENGKIILEAYGTSDNTTAKLAELVKVKRNNQVIYKATDSDFGEYYIINNAGDLEVYDSNGYVATYRRLK
jgi:hypothetical protein